MSWTKRIPMSRFDKCQNKVFVHNDQYELAKQYIKSNVMSVPGPSFNRHMESAFEIASTPKSKVLFMEIVPKVYDRLQRYRRKMIAEGDTRADRLRIIKGNVACYEEFANIPQAYRFEDIDLCQSMDTAFEILRYRLRRQSRLYRWNKAMVITSSLRHCVKGAASLQRTLTLLNGIIDMIGAELDVSRTLSNIEKVFTSTNGNGNKSVFMLTPSFVKKGRIFKMRLYRYRDYGQGVFSCIFLYK